MLQLDRGRALATLDGAGRAGRGRVDALVAGGERGHHAGGGMVGGRLCMPARYDDGRDVAIDTLKRWPTAARFDGARRIGVRIGALPVWRDRPASDRSDTRRPVALVRLGEALISLFRL